MSIIDRARDALNRWKYGTPHESANAAIELTSSSAAYAAAVVRAADLADKLKAQGERLGKSTYVHERAEGAGYAAAAAQLVATLEGENDE